MRHAISKSIFAQFWRNLMLKKTESPSPQNQAPVPDLDPGRRSPLFDKQLGEGSIHSRYFRWDRDLAGYKHVFITDSRLKRHHLHDDKVKYAWMVESPEIIAEKYAWVEQNAEYFKHIFTFRKSLLDIDPAKFKFVPGGSCWIKEKDWGIHEKSKLVSIIASDKNLTSGHRLRLAIVQALGSQMDVYGRGINYIPDKIAGLRDYRFSFAVENTKEDYYFTEKLLDCFMTGTVPIYYGCPSIGQFFNLEGILTIDNLAEAEAIRKDLSPELYQKMRPAILDNYARCLEQFLSYEDYLYLHYAEHLFGPGRPDGA